MKKHYVTHVEDTDKSISVAGPVLDYKQWYTDYIKLMEEQAQRKYGLYTPEDAFPTLPGDVTRWSFKGLTNEQMSKNPSLEDADGKGRFLTFKNFAWSGMSGCNGYDYDFTKKSILNYSGANVNAKISSDTLYIEKIDNSRVNAVIRLAQFKCRLKITGVSDSINSGEIRLLRMYSSKDFDNRITINTDGIYDVDIPNQEDGLIYIFAVSSQGTIENPLTLTTPITIEQLPYYLGFIIGDGVDDCAVTEKDLDFEDTYTVYTAFIPFQEDPARNMLLCGKAYKKDFYVQYQNLNKLMYYSAGTRAIVEFSNGFNLIACKRTPTQMVAKNLLTGETIVVDANSLVENPGLYYLWTTSSKMEYAKAAIAGQVICNGHFTTDEEDTKVLNWYKKEYPWLFFDQAWTVTGKTNEDTGRATIANITGNGNNLVLSNFGFAGNSGYGEYAYNWNEWGIDNGAATNVSKQYNKFVAVMPVNQSISTCNLYSSEVSIGTKFQFKLKITGLTTNWIVRVMEGYTGDSNIIYEFDKDGTYQIDHTMTGSGNQLRLYIRTYCAVPNAEGTTVTVEQIPDHEGYLVTDGVDDKIESAKFNVNKDFTVVGEWELLDSVNVAAGIVKPNSFFVYNAVTGTQLFLNSTMKVKNYPTKSLKAFCSDGRVYDSNWVEYLQREEQTTESSVGSLNIGINGDKYAQLALKNIAFFNGKYLSKEDMIKAYIYLQTLKAK